jgi:hypothetical protein
MRLYIIIRCVFLSAAVGKAGASVAVAYKKAVETGPVVRDTVSTYGTKGKMVGISA